MQLFEIGTIVHFNAHNEYYGESVYGQTRNLVISGVRNGKNAVNLHTTYYVKRLDGSDPTNRKAGYVNKAYHYQLVADVFMSAARKAIKCHSPSEP